MSHPGVKAGLIGGGLLVLVNLFGLVPVIGCCSLFLELLVYLGIGVLAGFWLAPRRESGRAAGQGAIAGLIAGLINGFVSVALAPVSMSLLGGSQAIVRQLPPESLQALQSAGLDPYALFSPGTMAGLTLVCCLPVGLIIGAALGAIGGLIFAAAKPE